MVRNTPPDPHPDTPQEWVVAFDGEPIDSALADYLRQIAQSIRQVERLLTAGDHPVYLGRVLMGDTDDVPNPAGFRRWTESYPVNLVAVWQDYWPELHALLNVRWESRGSCSSQTTFSWDPRTATAQITTIAAGQRVDVGARALPADGHHARVDAVLWDARGCWHVGLGLADLPVDLSDDTVMAALDAYLTAASATVIPACEVCSLNGFDAYDDPARLWAGAYLLEASGGMLSAGTLQEMSFLLAGAVQRVVEVAWFLHRGQPAVNTSQICEAALAAST